VVHFAQTTVSKLMVGDEAAISVLQTLRSMDLSAKPNAKDLEAKNRKRDAPSLFHLALHAKREPVEEAYGMK